MKLYFLMLGFVLCASTAFAQAADGQHSVPASAVTLKSLPYSYVFRALSLSRSYDVNTKTWSYDLDNISKNTTNLKPQEEMVLLEKEFVELAFANPQLMNDGMAENFKKQFPAYRAWVEKAAAAMRSNSTKGKF